MVNIAFNLQKVRFRRPHYHTLSAFSNFSTLEIVFKKFRLVLAKTPSFLFTIYSTYNTIWNTTNNATKVNTIFEAHCEISHEWLQKVRFRRPHYHTLSAFSNFSTLEIVFKKFRLVLAKTPSFLFTIYSTYNTIWNTTNNATKVNTSYAMLFRDTLWNIPRWTWFFSIHTSL